MSTIKNDQILLYCHFNKIIKGPGTSFHSPKTCQKCLLCTTLVFDQISFCQCVEFKRNKHKCNLHYVPIFMMISQILKFVHFTKAQRSRYLENKTLFFLQIKKFINYTSVATLLQKTVLQQRLPLKLVSTNFYQIFIFSPNDSPSKTMKSVFYFI